MNKDSISMENGYNKSMREGNLTKAIEKQTAKMPSSIFLILAGGAVALSLGLAVTKNNSKWATFVGEWVPTILLLGVYNKIVKTQGSDNSENKKILQ